MLLDVEQLEDLGERDDAKIAAQPGVPSPSNARSTEPSRRVSVTSSSALRAVSAIAAASVATWESASLVSPSVRAAECASANRPPTRALTRSPIWRRSSRECRTAGVRAIGIVGGGEIFAGDERGVVVVAPRRERLYLWIECWTTAVIASGENGFVM
ncbi:MAG: hypothetical protein WKF78_04600 [Candidatus Limnocylindrales bacterium]